MTICIGILASDGVVIAADREEGDGYLKNDRGKIYQAFRGSIPTGSIAVTGAGDGPSLDGICNLMANAFSDERDDPGFDAAEKALVETHRKYYHETIMPFSLQPQLERPDYSLIVGCVGGGLGKKLFSTSRLGFNSSGDYEAVGVGASVANTWLGKLYDYLPLRHAVKVAAYVIYQVKTSVGGCGLGTDIAIVKPDRPIPETVAPATIRKWEDAFRYLQTLERNVFHYCLGVDETQEQHLMRSATGKEPINSQLEDIRKMFMPLVAQKSTGQQ
jgi:20S proteasome alpha/beta subunit